ncbi:nuclear transport factor 2 [Apodospora peruviana]|uniref:Nuclear transport factor 2 n=1 Tax=Apodospora peruviana TaxID=516989 RepID=A0AAE0I0H9_9PEZI|nr:nuclear transport factor 2 [Apodospora peruviana]
MAEYEAVAKQFVEHYYNTFDSNRSALAPLYRDESMLTFQSAQVGGGPAIAEKLASLPFQKVKHQINSFESQPTPGGAGIIILVAGALLVDEEQNPLNYAQTFQLVKDPAGAWFLFNDIFSLLV